MKLGIIQDFNTNHLYFAARGRNQQYPISHIDGYMESVQEIHPKQAQLTGTLNYSVFM